MTTPLIHSDGELSEFDVTASLHPDCEDCWGEAISAAITAKVTGSVGATHSTNSPDGEHSATVKRVRCHARNARSTGGDCCCSICLGKES